MTRPSTEVKMGRTRSRYIITIYRGPGTQRVIEGTAWVLVSR